jgi:hypothetical protein
VAQGWFYISARIFERLLWVELSVLQGLREPVKFTPLPPGEEAP